MNLPCFQEGSFVAEIGMTEKELVMIPTKELNQMMEAIDVSREDKKRIKQRRRTLLNRYIIRAVQILCLLPFVDGNQLTLQCKIFDDKGKSKETALLWRLKTVMRYRLGCGFPVSFEFPPLPG